MWGLGVRPLGLEWLDLKNCRGENSGREGREGLAELSHIKCGQPFREVGFIPSHGKPLAELKQGSDMW